MCEREVTAALYRDLQVPKLPQVVIRERKCDEIFEVKKRHAVLDADPLALREDSAQWHLSIADEGNVRCPNCGTAHKNSALILCYRICHHCMYVLRVADDIEIREDQLDGLHILAAAYGHPNDASQAVDVTEALRSRVEKSKNEYLRLSTTENLASMFISSSSARGDGCRKKTLKVRYVINGRRGEASAAVCETSEQNCHLESDLVLLASRKLVPLITILKAIWGHPRGAIKGRGAFDVTQALQYRVDSTMGRYCAISRQEDMSVLFGEPARDRTKNLVIEYEITGKAGELHEYEIRDRLAKDVDLDAAPSMAPQIIVDEATYGWTEAIVAERRKVLERQLYDVHNLQHRRSMGLALDASQSKRLRTLPHIQQSLHAVNNTTLGHVDVTEILQRRIETDGGHILLLRGKNRNEKLPDWAAHVGRESSPDDLSEIFGNPLPGRSKLLKISYTILGHDADNRTEAPEVTSSGYESNFIKQKKGVLIAEVNADDETGRAYLKEALLLGVPTTLPSIEVCYASYGHPVDTTRVWDVTVQMKKVVAKHGGRRIHVSTSESLSDLFGGDPCRGARKMLKIRYCVRGFRGCCRIDESPSQPNRLRTDVAIGFVSEGSDVFLNSTRQYQQSTYRSECIERNMLLRRPMKNDNGTLLGPSPYSHLGISFS